MHTAYPTRLVAFTFVLALLLVNAFTAFAQPEIQLDLVGEPVCNIDETYCATIKIKLKDSADPADNTAQIGTSSVMVLYNISALGFQSYTSLNFDENNTCFPPSDQVAVWAPQGFSGSQAGVVNITTLLSFSLEQYSCPVLDNDWIDFGRICFDILDDDANIQLGFSNNPDFTNFNANIPNNGTVGVAVDYTTLGNIQGTAVLDGVDAPIIINGGNSELCQVGTGTPSSTTLSFSNSIPSGFTPQWLLNNSIIPGETGTSITVSQAGTYSVYFLSDTDGNCTSAKSNDLNITVVDCSISTGQCPVISSSFQVENLCDGGFNLNSLLTQWENNISIISDIDGTAGNLVISGSPIGSNNFPTTTESGNYVGDGCNVNIQTWYAAYECDTDGDGTVDDYVNAGILTLNIFPIPQAPSLSQTFDSGAQLCDYIVEPLCLGDTYTLEETDLTLACEQTPTDVMVTISNGNGCEETFQVARAECISCGLPECQLAATDFIFSECADDGTFTMEIEYNFNPNYTGELIYAYDEGNNFAGSGFLGSELFLGPFDGDGSTISFNLYNIGQPGCIVSTGPITTPLCGDCSDQNIQVIENLDLCSGDVLDLNSLFAANSNTSWTATNGGPLTGSEVVASNESCAAVVYQYQGLYTDDGGDCNINYYFYANIYIYPTRTFTTVYADDCTISVSASCNGTGITWEDSQGNTGTGVNYQADENNAGTVTFTAVNTSLEGCSSSYDLSYNCGNSCLPNAQTSQASTEVCSGSAVNLDDFIPNSNYTNLEWASNNATVNNSNSVVLNNSNCTAETQTFTATYMTQDAQACTIDHTFTLSATVFAIPEISITSSDECLAAISVNCSDFNVAWTDNSVSGNTGTGTDYQAAQGTNGNVTFTATNPNFANCTASITVNYDCPILCPDTAENLSDTEIVCNGTSLDMNTYIPTENPMNVQWFNPNGIAITNPENKLISNNTCSSVTRDYYANYQTVNAQGCTIDYVFVLETTVYSVPVFSTLSSDDCSVEVSVNCPNLFDITWSDNEGNSGTGGAYTAQEGSAGLVSFSTSNPQNSDCSSDFGYTYNCEANCDPINESETASAESCSGKTLDLDDYLTNAGIANLQWFNSNGNTINNPNNVVLENNNCTTSIETFTANYQTAENSTGCPIENEFILSVTIYPVAEVTLVSSDNCSVEVAINCSDLNLSWADTDGNTGTGTTYQATMGTTGQVTFTAINSNDCEASTFAYAYSCPLVCEPVFLAAQVEDDFCSGTTIDLYDYLTDNNYSNLQWTLDGNPVVNPSNLTLTNNDCQGLASLYTAIYQTTDAQTGCPIDHELVVSIEVYPIPNLSNLSSGACGVSVNVNCPNLQVSWTDTQGNNGIGTNYEAITGTTGQVTFSTTSDCGSDELTFAFSCPADCTPSDVTGQSFASFCSGVSFDLNDQLPQSNLNNIQWTDGNGISISNTTVTAENNDCDSFVETYIATYESLDASGCPLNTTFTLSVEIAPLPSLSLLSNEDCAVIVVSTCPNVEIVWQDAQGNSGTGPGYEANNSSGFVIFTASNNFGVLCNDQLVIDYSCDIPCAEETSSTLPIIQEIRCSGESINLTGYLNTPSQTNIVWTDGNGQTISNASNYQIINNSCTPISENLTATWSEIDENGCTNNFTQNVTLKVYTAIDFTTSTHNCSVSISTNCSNDIDIFWQDINGNQGSGTDYEALDAVGIVNFIAVWNQGSSTCEDAIAVPYSCNENSNPTGQTDLEITVEVGNAVDSYNIGDWVFWTVTLENTSAVTANDVIVSVPLPNGVDYLTSAGDGVYNELNSEWTLGAVPPFTIRTLVIYAYINEGGLIITSAEVLTANEPDVDSSPNNSNTSEDDYGEDEIEVEPAEGPQGEGGDGGACDSDIFVCTQEFTSIEVCMDFCTPNMVISDLSSPGQCNVVKSAPQCFNYLPYPSFSGTHEIEVTACNSAGGCLTAVATIEVDDDCLLNARLENNLANCDLEIPNIVTPNNDGVNDTWSVSDLYNCYEQYEMNLIIFNRFGQMVIEKKQTVEYGIRELWEGVDEYQTDTYFYILQLNNEERQKSFTGFIELRK